MYSDLQSQKQNLNVAFSFNNQVKAYIIYVLQRLNTN